MGAPQAKFEFVATGDAAVNAQIEGVVNKLVQMKARAQEAGETTAMSMEKAHIATHLLNEELGLGIPRAMQRVMSMVPGLSSALAMAFPIVAAAGFAEIISTLIGKIPEMTDAMMGFGEEAKKAFEDLKSGNDAIVKAMEANDKQALQDALIGLSGSGLDRANKQQIEAARDKALTARNDAAKAATDFSKTHAQPVMSMVSDDVSMDTGETIMSDEDIKKLNELQKAAQDAQAKFDLLDGAVKSVGKHLSHDIGDEGKAAFEKALAAINPVLAAISNGQLNDQELARNNAQKPFDAQIAQLLVFGKTYGMTQAQIEDAVQKLRLQRLIAGQEAFNTQRNKDLFAGLGAGTTGPDLGQGVNDRAAKMEEFQKDSADMQAKLAAEAAQEKVVQDAAKSSGEEQFQTEEKLMAIRGQSAEQLQAMADRMEDIAKALGDSRMIAEADKFEAKLQDLRIKTASWSTELKKSIVQDGQNLFVGLASGAETWAQAFQNAGQSILAELAKIIYQMYIVKLLQAAMNGITGGGGGSGGSGGTSVMDAFSTGIIPHAMGGPVSPGQTYLVGERGPELMRFGASGYITPNSQVGSAGGGMPVQVNIHNYGQPMEQEQTSRFDGEQYVVDVVIRNIQSNGPIRQALR